MSDFVHLHNHSDYSLLDAAQTVEKMCSRVYDLGMNSIMNSRVAELIITIKSK